MLARFIATVCVIGMTAFAANAAPSQEDGMSGLHAKVRIGGKLCMADHFHHGKSSGAASRKAAEASAMRDWAEFTAWEYSGAWGSYLLAVSKTMTCTQSGATWGCSVSARPCRR